LAIGAYLELVESICLETFVANEFNDIFSGRQLRQDVKVAPKLMTHESSDLVLPNHQQTLKMGTVLRSRLVENHSHLDTTVCL
jgi:hypothetical protein